MDLAPQLLLGQLLERRQVELLEQLLVQAHLGVEQLLLADDGRRRSARRETGAATGVGFGASTPAAAGSAGSAARPWASAKPAGDRLVCLDGGGGGPSPTVSGSTSSGGGGGASVAGFVSRGLKIVQASAIAMAAAACGPDKDDPDVTAAV